MAKKSLAGPVMTLLVLGVLGAGGYYGYQRIGLGKVVASQSVPSAPVVRGTLLRTVDSIGELKAARSSVLVSPFEGQVVQLVPEGTRVEEGDGVVWLDTEGFVQSVIDEEARLALAQKDLEAAREEYRLQEIQNQYNLQSEQARVELAEQRLRDAEQQYETEMVLVEKRISARSRLEEAELRKLQTAVELRNARINLRKTEENLGSNLRVRQNAIDKVELDIQRIERRIVDFQERIEQAVMRAPVAGEVTYLRIWRSGTLAKLAEGDSVWARLNIAEIPDRTEMLAVIPVNELDIASVNIGNPATVVLDALPGSTFTGKVRRKSIMPIDQSQTTTGAGPREFEVEIALDVADPRMFTGMTAAVRVEIGRRDDAVLVPLEALTLQDEEVGVWVAGGSFVPVKVGLINDRMASVTGDVADGAQVALRRPDMRAEESRTIGFEALRTVREELRQVAMAEAAARAEAERAAREAAGAANGNGDDMEARREAMRQRMQQSGGAGGGGGRPGGGGGGGGGGRP